MNNNEDLKSNKNNGSGNGINKSSNDNSDE